MAKTIVRVEGFRELEKALSELPKATGKAVLRRVLAKAAQPIFEAAKARAPSRPQGSSPVYYGREGSKKLRRPGTNESLVASSNKLTRNQARLAKKEGKNSAEHYVGSRDPIARLLEFGTSEMPAQPIFRPAWQANKNTALDTIKSELGFEITSAAARIARKAAKLAAKG